MAMNNFLHNVASTTRSAHFPIIIISPLALSISYYLYRLYDVSNLSQHYAFLYHILVSPLVMVPFALSIRERTRLEDLGYTYRCNAKAVGIYVGYCLLTAITWAYIRTYWLESGALASTLNVLMGWSIVMGVNLVPLWILAKPLKPKQL